MLPEKALICKMKQNNLGKYTLISTLCLVGMSLAYIQLKITVYTTLTFT